MKYVMIFLVVFVAGFSALTFWDNEKESPATVVPVPETPPAAKAEDTLISNNEADTFFQHLPDTFNYKRIGEYYDISWKDLSRVRFEERMNEALQIKVPYPVFHYSVKQLDGKKIQIKGYVIPFEETGDATIVILSAFPFSNCFFCGGAGAETVIDVQLKNQRKRFKQDAMVTFRGKLRLNDSDLDYLNYILDDAEILQ